MTRDCILTLFLFATVLCGCTQIPSDPRNIDHALCHSSVQFVRKVGDSTFDVFLMSTGVARVNFSLPGLKGTVVLPADPQRIEQLRHTILKSGPPDIGQPKSIPSGVAFRVLHGTRPVQVVAKYSALSENSVLRQLVQEAEKTVSMPLVQAVIERELAKSARSPSKRMDANLRCVMFTENWYREIGGPTSNDIITFSLGIPFVYSGSNDSEYRIQSWSRIERVFEEMEGASEVVKRQFIEVCAHDMVDKLYRSLNGVFVIAMEPVPPDATFFYEQVHAPRLTGESFHIAMQGSARACLAR